jgi:ribonuclease R
MNKYYEGTIHIDKHMRAFCEVPELGVVVKIGTKFLNHALPADKVLIKIKDGNKHGFVQKVIERNQATITGQIQITAKHAFVKPWNAEYNRDFYIAKEHIGEKTKDGDIVEIQILNFPKNSKSPTAKVIKTLFKATSDQYMMHRMNLPTKFPEDVLQEVNEINPNRDYSDRIDLRHLNVISIDPQGSKDLDDALSLENTGNGYRVGIHIADVTAWLKTGTKLDQEAYKRGTSIYMPSTCIPMLPPTLSYDLCSLLPNKDRLAVSVMINFDREWNVMDYYIFRSVINNRKQFTYEEAEEHRTNSNSDYYSDLNMLYMVGQKVRKQYFPNELELTLPDIKWELDENGDPIKVKAKKRIATNDLIQAWMLMTNMLVTKKIQTLGVEPWIYRVHNTLAEDKLASFKTDIKQLDIEWNNALSVSENLVEMLASEKASLVSDILVRKFRSAYYAPKKKIHFALGTADYAHFTSPIRRYPDVIVHRILLKAIEGKGIYCANIENDCKHLTQQERKADEVEKIAHQTNMLKFVKDVKYSMQAVIVNFSKRGIMVRTELMADGFVPAKELDANWNEEERRWVNFCNWKIGDIIQVKIAYLDWAKRDIVLKLV